MKSDVLTGHDVMEESEGVYVELSLDWQFSKEKVETRDWRTLAQFKETSESFILEYCQGIDLHRSNWKC